MKATTERPTTLKTPYQTKGIERCSYGVYFFGQGLVYAIVSQYLMYYYTDYIHLPALVISGIMFVGKIWDAVNDTLFGLLVDKIRFKNGNKFLPWLKIATVIVPVGTLLVFSIPASLSMPLRIALAVLSYVMWDLFYTVCDAPIFALSTAMTSNIKERSAIMTFSSIGGTLAVGITTIFLVPFFDKNGFFKTALIIAILSFFSMGLISVFGKERYKVALEPQESPTLKDSWNYLRRNKYLLIYYLYRLISGSIAVQTLTYVAKYCLGDIKYVSIIAACSILPILGLYALSPKILKRFDKITIYRFCAVCQILMNGITLFVGYKHVAVLVFCMVILATLAILPTILMSAIPADCVEYGTYKTGIRKEGITFALQTFVLKLASAFAAAITGFVLSGIGYDATVKAMPQATMNSLWRWNFIIPIVGQTIALGLLFLYHLKDSDAQIMADVNAGKMTREEAEKNLSRPY